MKKSDLKQFIKEEIKSALSQPIKEGEIPGKIGKIESIINDLGEGDLEAIIQYMKEKGRLDEMQYDGTIQSDILNTWVGTDVAQADLEIFLEMLYTDGNHDTMEDMRQMFGRLSSIANDYYKKMKLS
jgi:hypothetical protein|tara:strand:- start:674 stop:1054 length:381 start_codon:yes stop_codon:yes gene_type:complete